MNVEVDFEGILGDFVSSITKTQTVSDYAKHSPRRAIRAMGIQRFQRRQGNRRMSAGKQGISVPPILIASVTRRCNIECAGCYSKALRQGKGEELSTEKFLDIVQEAVGLGVSVIMVAGDELFRIGEGGNIIPIFSVEGRRGQTDTRRGAGVHDTVLQAMDEMRRRNLLFGVSITATSANADLIRSPEFIRELSDLGPTVLFLVEYVPAVAGTDELVLREEQRTQLNDSSSFEAASFEVVPLPGDEEKLGGCLAAGRGFIHMAEDSSLEACPFATFSDTNAARLGFKAALASPLMRALREHHGELGESKGGCSLWNKGGWVAGLSLCGSQGIPLGGKV